MGVIVVVLPTSIVMLALLRVIPVTGRTTVTVHAAVISLLLFETAVIVALPGLMPRTTPSASTVATALLLETHKTLESVAFAGTTVAVIALIPPSLTVTFVGERVRPVTG